MGGSVSGVTDYSQFGRYQADISLLQTALAYKTQKLSENRAALQTARDTLGMIDVAKDVDQQYLDNRLAQTTDIINKYANGDLSNDGLAQSLVAHMGQVLDSNVKNAITSTKRYNSEQAEWAKMREKAPKEYSALNHSFANRGSNAWLKDNKVGSTYSGGGGYIPYTDVSAIFQKALPDAVKALEAQGKTVQANGLSLDTYQGVSRAGLQAALSPLMTGDVQKQMEINAWGTYGHLPEEALRQEWDNHITPQIESANNDLENLKALQNSATDPATKRAYADQIEATMQRKSNLEDQDYDTVVSIAGKEGLYNKMHTDKFMDDYLNAYSYAPKLIDHKIDEVQKFHIEQAFKQKEFDEKVKHNRATEDIAMFKAGLKKDKNGNLVGGTSSSMGADVPVDSDKEKASILADLTKDNINTYNALKTSIKKSNPNITDGDLNSKEFQQLLKNNGHLKSEMVVNGKKITVTNAIRKYAQDHKENVIEVTPEKNLAFQSLDGTVQDVQKNLLYGLKTNNTVKQDIPDFFVKHVKYDKNGETHWSLKVIRPNDKEFAQLKGRYHKLLIGSDKQDKWTEADKRDFKLYTTMQLANDTSLDQTKKSLMMEKALKDFNYLDPNSLNILTKKQTAYMEDTRGGYWDKKLSDITKGDVVDNFTGVNEKHMSKQDIERRIAHLKKQRDSDGVSDDIYAVLGFTDPNKNLNTAIAHYEKRLVNKDYNKYNINGINTIIKDGFDAAINHLESANLSKSREFAAKTQVISKTKNSTEEYNRWAHLAGFDAKAGNDISLQPLMKDGVPTNELVFAHDVKVKTKDGYKIETQFSQPFTKEKLDEAGIMNVDLGGNARSRYNAQSPYARPISLGNGIYSEIQPKGLSKDQLNFLMQKATGSGKEQSVQTVLNGYKQGLINVKLVPVEGQYCYQYLDAKGNMIAAPIPAGYSEVLNLPEILNNPKIETDFAISQLIDSIINND